ncbi:malate synthase [Pseudomonas sp. St29]|nr:malate synthase [Pseudomonas sp. St29]
MQPASARLAATWLRKNASKASARSARVLAWRIKAWGVDMHKALIDGKGAENPKAKIGCRFVHFGQMYFEQPGLILRSRPD